MLFAGMVFRLPPVGVITAYEVAESSSGRQPASGVYLLKSSSLGLVARRALQG